MKSFVIVVLLGFISFFSSVIVVNQTEYGIANNSLAKEQTVYMPGIHFIVPFITDVVYISRNMNQSNYILNKSGFKLDIVASWHTVNPILYWQKRVKFNQVMESQVNIILDQNIANLANPNEMLNLTQLQFNKSSLSSLGIILDNIVVINLSLLNTQNTASLVPSNQIIESSDESNSLTNAYIIANQIKTHTEIDIADIYSEIESTNIKFYNYFRTLNAYKWHNKAQLPPLNQLYQ